MYRRTFVASAAAATVAVTAGCARPVETDPGRKTPPKIDQQTPTSRLVPSLPVPEVKATVASAIDSAPESASLETFESTLADHADGATLSEYDEHLSLTYTVGQSGGVARTVGVTAGTYAAYVEATDDARPLSVSLLADGRTVGEYAVPPEWAVEYRTGTTTAKEYAEKVLGTLKTKR